jgi:hypothetical protein
MIDNTFRAKKNIDVAFYKYPVPLETNSMLFDSIVLSGKNFPCLPT